MKKKEVNEFRVALMKNFVVSGELPMTGQRQQFHNISPDCHTVVVNKQFLSVCLFFTETALIYLYLENIR
jgi:hypothetical protein